MNKYNATISTHFQSLYNDIILWSRYITRYGLGQVYVSIYLIKILFYWKMYA